MRNRDAAQDAATVARIEAVAEQDIGQAVEMARTALADGLVHPMLLYLRSHWWSQQGRTNEALADLQQGMIIAPLDPHIRNAYGMMLGTLERWPLALEILRESVTLNPEFPAAHYGLGWALENTGDVDGAKREFGEALALNPDFVRVMVHLADFAQRKSDWETAEPLVERILAIVPDHYVALTIKGNIALAKGDIAQAEALITPLLGRSAETPLDASSARRALGDIRHAQERYAQAFAAYTHSNKQRYEIYRGRYEMPNNATVYADWLAEHFAGADRQLWSAKRADAPADDHGGARGHVFLVGFPRSGTTLLENVLASHPDIVTLEERDTFGDLTHKFLVNDAGRDRLAALDAAQIAEHRQAYWDRVASFGADVAGKVFVDKYPLSSLKLPMIAKLFPGAKVLFAVRDPRDVVLSCYRRNFAMNSYMFEFLDMARTGRFYDAVMRLSAIYRERLEQDWLQVHNEALVEDFEGEARGICDFMGLEWSAEMRDFAQHAKSRTIRTPSSAQVLRGLNREGMGAWRHYAKEMAPAMPLLERWVAEYGYTA